jgi:hypothetical protein
MDIGRIRDTLQSSIPPFEHLVFDSTKNPNPTVKEIVQQDLATITQVLSEFNLGPDLIDLVSCLYDGTIHYREDIVCPYGWFELKEDIHECILPEPEPEAEPEPKPEKQIINKSKTSLANILRNIDKLLPNIKKLPPAQQKEQNNYATMIKSNIVNLTEEDLSILIRIFNEGETKEQFNEEYDDHITTDITPIGDKGPRFNDIIRDLPKAPASAKAKRDNIMQKFGIKEQVGGRKTRRKTKVSQYS